MPVNNSDFLYRRSRQIFRTAYKQWSEAEDHEKSSLEGALRQHWRAVWEHGASDDRVTVLRFISRALLNEAETVISEALESDDAETRDMGAEAAVMYFARTDNPPSPRSVDALWAYLTNVTNRRRVLALLTLERLGRVHDARLMRLVQDPDERVRRDVRKLLRKAHP